MRRAATLLALSLRRAGAVASPNAAAPPPPRWPPAALASARRTAASDGTRSGAVDGSASTSSSAPATAAPGDDDDGPTTTTATTRHRPAELAAVFTCNVCETRGAKGFSRAAYERGVVIVTCGGCTARHVLADRLGWFGAPGAVDDFLAEAGEGVRRRAVEARGAGGVLEVTEEEVAGWSRGRENKGGAGGELI